MDIVEKAKEFALRFHGDQNHGSLKIADHLAAVTEKLKLTLNQIGEDKFADAIVAAGWLHDTVEDTSVDFDQLQEVFGPFIANIVRAVTDSDGKNRLERHIKTYWRTRENGHAIIVKMCDRWHNHKRSIERNERFVKMYSDEYLYFKFALYRPGVADALWNELDEQYEKMKRM